MTRVLVCGGRDFTDYQAVKATLDTLPITWVIHGNARGADTMADRWAINHGKRLIVVPAEWAKYGKRAGGIRNQNMLGHGPEVVVAFPGGAGTRDMVKRAEKAGIPVIRAGWV